MHVVLACSHFKEKHFCITKCLDGLGFSDDYFYLFVRSSEYTKEFHHELMYLIDSVKEQLKLQTKTL